MQILDNSTLGQFPDPPPAEPRSRFSEECRHLFRQTGIGLWEFDVERSIYRGDATTKAILGIRREGMEFPAEDVYSRVAPEAPTLIAEKIAEAVSRRLEEQSFDLAIVGDDGRPRWIRNCARNEFDEAGRLVARYGTIRDVSDEPRLQTWDPRRENRLTCAIRGARAIPWEYDVEEDTFTVDPISSDDTEFPAGRPIAMAKLLERVHPDDRDTLMAIIERQRRDPTRVLHAQYRVRNRDGNWKWVLARGEYRPGEEGRRGRIYGVNIDVTPLHDTAPRSRRSPLEEPPRDTAIGHWEFSLRTFRISLSPDLTALVGFAPAESYGLEELKRLILEEDHAILAKAIEEGLKPDGKQGGEIALRIRVGDDTRYLRATAVVTRDDTGSPLALVGVALDLTDVSREEARLRESRQGAETAAALSTVFEWEMEPANDVCRGEGRLKELLFGSDFEGCALKALLDGLNPEQRWTLSRCINGVDDEATTRIAHTRFVRDDGSVFHLRTYAWTAEASEGRPVRRQGIIQDITRRLEADDELRVRAEGLSARIAEMRIMASKACCWAWDYEADREELLPIPQFENPFESGPIIFDERRKTLRLKPAGDTHDAATGGDTEGRATGENTATKTPVVRAWGLLPDVDHFRGAGGVAEGPVVAAYWEYDPENDCIRGGAPLREFLRLGEGETTVPRARVEESIHPEDRRNVFESRRRILEERLAEACVAFRLVIGGRVRHIVAYTHQEFDAEGALIFQNGVFTDVTDRQRVEAAVLRIASETSGENWDELLRRITSALAEIVSADAVVVAMRGEVPQRMRTLIVWEGGTFRPNRECDAGTSACVPRDRHEFRIVARPADDDPALRPLDDPRAIAVYAAFSCGEAEDDNEVDILVAFRGTVENREPLERIVRLYAARVAAGLKRYRAEFRLRESEGLFREMAENSIFAIRILRGDRYVYANSRYREIVDREDKDITGHRVSEFVDEATWDEIRYRLNRARMGIVETFDQRIRLKSGKETWLRGYARPITYRGEPALMAVFVDISDRKRLEDELREAIDRFTLGVRASRMDAWELDIRSRVCVYQCNGSGDGAFPPSISRFGAEEYLCWVHPDDQDHVRAQFDAVVAGTTRTYAADYRLKTPKCRDWRWITAVAEVFKWDTRGRPVLLVGMQRDVTEERETQRRLAEQAEQLQHSQKMDAVGQLAGGVAHEFNNLLQVISGYGELLKDVVGSEETAEEYLDAVFSASRRGTELVRQLLQFSHKEAPRTAPVELDDVIRGMRDMLDRVLGENIRLDFACEADRLVIRADEGQLRQVLMNLCINARDAIGPRDGNIRLRLRRETLSEDKAALLQVRPGEYAILSICDDGPGIPRDIQDKIFEPFFTTKEIGKGTGLGLAAVQGIVEHHRGAIRLESAPGAGATFHVYLPEGVGFDDAETPDASEQRPSRRTAAPVPNRMTALVAEDNPAVLELARTALANLGIRVIAAEDGAQAVERFREHGDEIDLLFFDVLMPRMTGPAAYERIREIGGDVPVIFATGHTDRVADLRGAGAASILLPKPYSGRTLQDAIESVLAVY